MDRITDTQKIGHSPLVSIRFNADLRAKYQQLIDAGKSPKLAIAAVMRKLVLLADALLRNGRKWTEEPA